MMRRAILFFALVIAISPALFAADPPATPVPGMPALVTPSPHAKPLDQVQISVWISEANETGLRELGTNLQYSRVVRGVEQSGSLQQVNMNTFDALNPSFQVTLPAPDQTLFDAPLRPDQSNKIPGIQAQSGGGIIGSVISPGYGTVDALFRGVEQQSTVDLVSKPEILVVDNGVAEIHAGGQVPYQNIAYTAQGVGQLNVTWQNIGVSMKIQPLIMPNNTVELKIQDLSVSDVVRVDNIRGIDLPVFATRKQTGNVVVPNNSTYVIGGLSSSVIQKTERRVPVLGKIPLVGIAFRGRNSRASRSNLLIFVKPVVVNLREMTPDANRALNFWNSPQWNNSERISKEVVVMQEEP